MKQLGMLVRSTTPNGNIPEALEFGTPCYTRTKLLVPNGVHYKWVPLNCAVYKALCMIMFNGCGQHLAAICHRNNHECNV